MNELDAVALGGGHGLHASLCALRLLTDDITAVVTVADDGGSSGRIRRELDVLPPGDLRMALTALANPAGSEAQWAQLMQHRIGGEGALAGHSVGNLLLTGLFETIPDPVEALRRAGTLMGIVGRVLPMSTRPLDLVGVVDRFDPANPQRTRQIRGQSSIAATPGRVRSVTLLPLDASVCEEAVAAVREADVVVLGPGSWFTSVIPHLLLTELGQALAQTSARVIVTVNLVPQVGETDGFSPVELLRLLLQHRPDLRIDAVVADTTAVPDNTELISFATEIGAEVILSDISMIENNAVHDPVRLAAAYRHALSAVGSRGRSIPSGLPCQGGARESVRGAQWP